MNNLLAKSASTSGITYYGRPAQQLFNRLDTLLLITKECKKTSCVDPFGVIFPGGQVKKLDQAMDPMYDDFFASQPQVSFASCSSAHITYLEGPQAPTVYPS